MVGIVLLAALALASGCGGEPEPAAADVEILVHGARGRHVLDPVDARRVPLLMELDSLLTTARPAQGALDRRALGLLTARGALEFRFDGERLRVDALGDSLRFTRVLLALGAEPSPPGGESGVLVLLGAPDYSPHPHLSARDRSGLLEALEGPAKP